MKVAISYTVDVDDDFREAIRLHYGQRGKASRAEVKRWFEAHGESGSDDLMFDLSEYRRVSGEE